jgi:hypothetical protein
LAVIVIGLSTIGISNDERALRNQIVAKQEVLKSNYDKMWKILSQQAGVSAEYKDSFKEIYPKLMEGRYGNARGGALMSWVHEANPEFSTALFEKLSDSIDVQRTEYFNQEQGALDLKREHDNMLTKFPSGFILGILGRQPITLKLVRSERTDSAFETGQDNDVDLFKKDKPTAPPPVKVKQ